MKLQAIEFPYGTSQIPHKSSKAFLLATLTLILLTIIPLYYPSLGYATFLVKTATSSAAAAASASSSSSSSYGTEKDDSIRSSNENCDIFTGEWVPNPGAPYYTNKTCWAIHEHQNCMKYGRPDTEFMKWRWKPDGCELPVFNPVQFLELVRDKSLAFVGDSVGRNQMQSLMCLLSRVEYPVDDSYTQDDYFRRWKYTTYNFTMAAFWTTHLIKSQEIDPIGPTNNGVFALHLDEFDESWTGKIEGFDYVIISLGHWFFRSLVFYENGRIIGCHSCLLKDVPDVGRYFGFRRALRTAFKAINSLKNYNGITILRTFAPSHFENGTWNKGGNCLRTRPFRSNETTLDGANLELYTTQLEEFRVAQREGRKRGLRYRLLDTTQAMLLRPDGHPSRYGHWPYENVTLYNDCVHWCLPGPIDTWSDFLLQMLKMEG